MDPLIAVSGQPSVEPLDAVPSRVPLITSIEPTFGSGPRISVAGVPFVATSLEAAVQSFVDGAADATIGGLPVRLSNAYCLALAGTDDRYLQVLQGVGVNLPDGTPVAVVMRRKGKSRGLAVGRVRGPSFFEGVLDAGRQAGLTHYFLGCTDDTLAKLQAKLEERYPGVRVAGSWGPPFGPLSDDFYDEAEQRVAIARPHVLWLGLGTPKQDYAAIELAARLGVPTVGVGAAFDFIAGTMQEAPEFMQRHGLEWVYRLVSEPRRLWRRYLFGNVRFLAAVVKHDLRAVRR